MSPTPTPPKYIRRAASLVFDIMQPGLPASADPDALRADLADALLNAAATFSTEDRKALWSKRWQQRLPPDLAPRLLNALAEEALTQWALNNEPQSTKRLGKANLKQRIADWLTRLPADETSVIKQAAVRHRLGIASDEDENLIRSAIGPALSSKEAPMSNDPIISALVSRLLEKYYFDVGNGLPQQFADGDHQGAYLTAVAQVLQGLTFDLNDSKNDTTVAAIVGTLLLLGQTDAGASGFEADVHQAWLRLMTTEAGNARPSSVIYAAAEAKLRLDRPDQKLSFQEVAYVGNALSTGETRADPEDPTFPFHGLVRVAAQDYLAQRSPFGELGDIPPLTGATSNETEIDPDNVRAVAWLYAAYQYEQVRLFDVVDRITELFMNGMLPIGLDSGGHALDRYHWDSEDRLSTAGRYSHYSRVVGAPGGEVSREVAPNSEFQNLWLRFLASLAEFDRQQRMADMMQQPRGLATTGEHVRKAGRDLAANMSLYGWAATHFIARRLEKQIRDAIGILRLPSIQKAYAVQSPWQVIERVTAMEFGQTPNIVRYDTMARSGKVIMDLVAKHHRVWSSTSGRPLFSTNNTALETLLVALLNNNAVARSVLTSSQPDIPPEDQNTFLTETQYWLAVNGVSDDEVSQRAQPALTAWAPSIPTTGGRTGGTANVDQLRQMISQGQMPSMDQLKQLVGGNGVGM